MNWHGTGSTILYTKEVVYASVIKNTAPESDGMSFLFQPTSQ